MRMEALALVLGMALAAVVGFGVVIFSCPENEARVSAWFAAKSIADASIRKARRQAAKQRVADQDRIENERLESVVEAQ